MITLVNNNQTSFVKKNLFFFELCKTIFNNSFEFFVFCNANNLSVDISSRIVINMSIEFLKKIDAKALNIIRHSCAHLLAHALKKLYPDVNMSIGPVTFDGFYYDFFLNKKISINDLHIIEIEMSKLVKKCINIEKTIITRTQAEKIFSCNKYKLDIIKNINVSKPITIYSQDDFDDLCKGPHAPNTKFLKYFKLTKIAGAYWKNNHENEMLKRIYGTVWVNKADLYNHLVKTNRLKISDHRLLGRQLQLFSFYNHSPGVVFWHKNGWQIFVMIKNLIRNILKKFNYFEVNTPVMLGDALFKKSGHIEKFVENMFINSSGISSNVLKPMSCPCHANIFKSFYQKSYKNLPFRLSEFGSCFRNELSGTLHGLMRLKNFTQDDGHIFCAEHQLKNEIVQFIQILKNTYYKFGFNKFKVVLSKKPNNILTNLSIWKIAEKILEDVIKCLDLEYSISNDGAFYGPKIEFSLRDNFNRLWQCGTIQVDFFTSCKLNAKFTEYYGVMSYPIILHRAILGSIERFVGVLLENNSGLLPFWISPIQIKIIYISSKYLFYAKNIYNIIKNKYNVEIYFGNERLEYKIKQCVLQKIPYIITLGRKEHDNKSVSIRSASSNKIVELKLKYFLTSFVFY